MLTGIFRLLFGSIFGAIGRSRRGGGLGGRPCGTCPQPRQCRHGVASGDGCRDSSDFAGWRCRAVRRWPRGSPHGRGSGSDAASCEDPVAWPPGGSVPGPRSLSCRGGRRRITRSPARDSTPWRVTVLPGRPPAHHPGKPVCGGQVSPGLGASGPATPRPAAPRRTHARGLLPGERGPSGSLPV